jgi:hypothetical protein
MKTMSIILLVMLPCVILASEDGNNGGSSTFNPIPENTDAITLTVINTWPITWAQQCLGMDVWEDGSEVYVIFSSPYHDGEIKSLDVFTGIGAGSINLPPSNPTAFGVAWNNEVATAVYYVDNWNGSDL